VKINKVRTLILAVTFLAGMICLPDFVYNIFWNKSFWDVLPFTLMYWQLILLYAIVSTICVEFIIRFIKKYA